MAAKISWRLPLPPARRRPRTGRSPFAEGDDAILLIALRADGASVAEGQRPRCFGEVLHRDPWDEAGLAKRGRDRLSRLRQRRPGLDPDSEGRGASLPPARSALTIPPPFRLPGELEGRSRSTGRGGEDPWDYHRRW